MSESAGCRYPSECPRCGAPVSRARTGRPRIWCSDRCRRLAHETALSAAEVGTPVRVVTIDTSTPDLDAAVEAVLSSPGASRRVLHTLARRYRDGALSGSAWLPVIDFLNAKGRR